jgi:hypothetical protein
MSAVLSQLEGAAATVLGNLLTVIPQGNIGGIAIPATLEETNTDLVNVTDHPVEAGAQITDHAYYRPAELVMRCGWSNSSSFTLQSAASSLFSGGGMSVSDFVSGIYSQLLALQQSLVPFTVVTSIRQYTNMMMTSLVVTRDNKTSQALMVTASMRQVIFVSTVSTTLAAIGTQANPASTAEQLNTGPLNLIPNATPNPGGSLPPSLWGPI